MSELVGRLRGWEFGPNEGKLKRNVHEVAAALERMEKEHVIQVAAAQAIINNIAAELAEAEKHNRELRAENKQLRAEATAFWNALEEAARDE